jgi:hypothetical protein
MKPLPEDQMSDGPVTLTSLPFASQLLIVNEGTLFAPCVLTLYLNSKTLSLFSEVRALKVRDTVISLAAGALEAHGRGPQQLECLLKDLNTTCLS